MFMDGLSSSSSNSVALAKALAPAFVIRGAQLSINRRLDGQHVIDIHTVSISWIIKRIAGYESSGNKKKKADAIEFFRVLHTLLATIESRDATKMCAHSRECEQAPVD
jgi:cohesin complex subunit SA-1/2